jgi:gluconolactonase
MTVESQQCTSSFHSITVCPGSSIDWQTSSYAYDVVRRANGEFLANKRVFAMADVGIPDGIKCDTQGNVYSGCGDGLSVWNPDGSLIGKILIPGGVANFCFARKGELILLNETRFWIASIDTKVQGALLVNRVKCAPDVSYA